jgi:[amino group carrier protein]-lysine/ornithine hydrolase
MASSSLLEQRQQALPTDDEQIELLTGLVQIKSLSGEERRAVEYLVAAMNERGFETSIDAVGNAVGTIGDGPTTFILLGHIDTVPGDIPVRIEDGVLYGRGSVDAKGPLATFVAAAQIAARSGNATIRVVGAVGEESIGSIGANEIAKLPAPNLCIIGEPSGWDAICLGYRGTVSFSYHLRQAARHTAGPGESVAEVAVGFWNDLRKEIEAINGDRTGFNAVGPSLRSMSTESNGLYDVAHLSIGLRLPPDIESGGLIGLINRLAGDAEIELHGVQEGYQTDKRSRLTPPFLRAIRAEDGTPRFTRKLGTSDMTVVGPVWQCPIVAYGPGDASLDHSPEEQIVLDDYLKAIRVLSSVLADL